MSLRLFFDILSYYCISVGDGKNTRTRGYPMDSWFGIHGYLLFTASE